MDLPKELTTALMACLNAEKDATVSVLRDLLTKRDFRFAPGFSTSDVDAIRVEYGADDFRAVARPIHRARGACGAGVPLSPSTTSMFDGELEETFVASCRAEQRDAAKSQLRTLRTLLYESWFRKCWKTARIVAPKVRGFFSVRDATWITDLDTGEEKREAETGFRFAPERG